MLPRDVFVAHTHRVWFDNLSRLARPEYEHGVLRLDEVNFWAPKAPLPLKRFVPGDLLFFRLGAPVRCIVGYGYFASFHPARPDLPADVHMVWELFGAKNGAMSKSEFAALLGRRSVGDLERPVGCTVLRDAVFWPESRWIPWGHERGYADTGLQRGRTDADPANVLRLMTEVTRDQVSLPFDFAARFVPLHMDERERVAVTRVEREGQATFRLRLLQAYDWQCAVTREHTEPVLDAAHIQPYLGPRSNHLQNGIVLTKEFHTLFDRGLATIEPPSAGVDGYRLRISKQISQRWNNGRRYYQYDNQELIVPANPTLRPSIDAVLWHRENVFERV